MLFTSYEFIGFCIIVLVLYYIIPKKGQWPLLLLASYVFYFLASPIYLIYIGITTVTVFLAGLALQKKKDSFQQEFAQKKGQLDRQEKKQLKAKEQKKERRILLYGLLLNLGILAVMKYTNFGIANVNGILHAFGSSRQLSFVNIIVPMGISFYTFQSLGYLIDVYRGKYEAEKNVFKFALFVSFFPQLVQGPISRFDDLAKTLYTPHKLDFHKLSFGLQRILWGFFKKLVIADRMLIAVKAITQNPDTYQGGFVLAGMLFYALELYADFTGGIDITIGVAEALGIQVTENFKRPFFSKNIKEYWNRWHITMGSWFTDYIFYPLSVSEPMKRFGKFTRKVLGTNLGKRVPVYLASFVVWFATGIWHGASWNFIVWGLGNFVVIMISQELEPLYDRFHNRFHVKGKFWYRLFQVVRTVLLMSCLRMFDCYRDVPLTFRMFGTMFTRFRLSQLSGGAFLGMGLSVIDYFILFLGCLLLIGVSLWQRSGSVREKISNKRLPIRFAIWYGLLLAVILLGIYGIGYDVSQFIYNQF